MPNENNVQEKLNINLKLNQVIDQLFEIELENSVGNGSENSCSVDNWLPRDSVRSVCKGCDPDLIDPPV